MGSALKRVCRLSETMLEKTNYSFTSYYKLIITSGSRMKCCIYFSFLFVVKIKSPIINLVLWLPTRENGKIKINFFQKCKNVFGYFFLEKGFHHVVPSALNARSSCLSVVIVKTIGLN